MALILQGRIAAALRQHGPQAFAGSLNGGAVKAGGKAPGGIPQGIPDLLAAGRIFRQHLEKVEQDFKIVIQGAEFGPADGNPGVFDPALVLQAAEEIVAAGVRPDIQHFTALDGFGQRQHPLSRPPQRIVVFGGGIGQPADRFTLLVVNAHLAVHIQQQHHLLPGAVRRNLAGEMKPGAVEQAAPGIANF